jgi:hypothetical protein
MLKAEIITPGSREAELRGLYAKSSSVSPYVHPTWIALLGKYEKKDVHWCTVQDGNTLICALPFVTRKKNGIPISFLEALPLDCYCTPMISRHLDKESASRAFYLIVKRIIRDSGIGQVFRYFPPEWMPDNDVPEFSKGHPRARRGEQEIYVKYFENINNEDELRSSYHSHHRRKLATAERSNIIINEAKTHSELTIFFGLMEETMLRNGKNVKFSKEFIVLGGQRIIEDELGTCILAHYNDKCVAGAFFLTSSDMTVYWLGGTSSDKDALRCSPMHAIFHTAMLKSLQNKIKVFELGGVPTQGLRDFKSRWGASLVVQPTYMLVSGLAKIYYMTKSLGLK